MSLVTIVVETTKSTRETLTRHTPASILRRYFPERFPYEPFGDPYERKRDEEERRLQDAPQDVAIEASSKM